MSSSPSSPEEKRARITHLDTVRGVAVMGILVMNSVSFAIELITVLIATGEPSHCPPGCFPA